MERHRKTLKDMEKTWKDMESHGKIWKDKKDMEIDGWLAGLLMC